MTFRTFALLAKCPLFIILCHAILFTFVASNNQSLVYSALFWLQPFLKNLGSITFWKHEEEEDRKEKGEREWKSKGIACVNKCTLFSFDAKNSLARALFVCSRVISARRAKPEYVAFPRITPWQIIDTATEIIDTIAKYVIIIYRNAYEKNLAFIDIV